MSNVFYSVVSYFSHHQVIGKNKKTIYSKHQNTTDMLDYQAVTDISDDFLGGGEFTEIVLRFIPRYVLRLS